VFFLACGATEGLWKTRIRLGGEYIIAIYLGCYRGLVNGFGHFIVCIGCVIFSMGMVGMVPGVVRWVQHLILPLMLSFCS